MCCDRRKAVCVWITLCLCHQHEVSVFKFHFGNVCWSLLRANIHLWTKLTQVAVQNVLLTVSHPKANEIRTKQVLVAVYVQFHSLTHHCVLYNRSLVLFFKSKLQILVLTRQQKGKHVLENQILCETKTYMIVSLLNMLMVCYQMI